MDCATYATRKDKGWELNENRCVWAASVKPTSGAIMTNVGVHGKSGNAVLMTPKRRPHAQNHAGYKIKYCKQVPLIPLHGGDYILNHWETRGVDRMRIPGIQHAPPPPAPSGMQNAYSTHPDAYRTPLLADSHALSRMPVVQVHGPQVAPKNSHFTVAPEKHGPVEDMNAIINALPTKVDAVKLEYSASKTNRTNKRPGDGGAPPPKNLSKCHQNKLKTFARTANSGANPFRPATAAPQGLSKQPVRKPFASARNANSGANPFRPPLAHQGLSKAHVVKTAVSVANRSAGAEPFVTRNDPRALAMELANNKTISVTLGLRHWKTVSAAPPEKMSKSGVCKIATNVYNRDGGANPFLVKYEPDSLAVCPMETVEIAAVPSKRPWEGSANPRRPEQISFGMSDKPKFVNDKIGIVLRGPTLAPTLDRTATHTVTRPRALGSFHSTAGPAKHAASIMAECKDESR
ncbi:unknown [Singapore grouper iridovirus]|uniref:Uncharacterized protein n=1 Tax=Singapore grouper iridovirus TaxID=262968 RepID=Q5YFC8_9VIRU|nr:hypothetical protein ORF137R [Singapore grouper iridovirus]AAS18152.1 unknown [Singapore grouper iridovirus]WAU86846.1 hypothetical protein ORF137R [Singapore grouper iridovirus]8HIF_y1 Chain y1, VP137 [Singapore grouper iridovirus]8HIF_y2 Chain y2, VP137 [Singapore grouper iridovirus]